MNKGDKKQSTLKANWKVFLKKRWSLPVLYLGCAAVIVSAVVVLQNPGDKDVASDKDDLTFEQNQTDWAQDPSEEVTEVNQSVEKMAMPVVDPNAIVINRSFYDQNASAEEQQDALIVVNQNYYPNQGIDIVQDGESSFEVLAAMSGTVTVVQEDPFIGNAIEIEHADGLVTKYNSIEDITVQVGDDVNQGQPIAMSGTSELNVEAETHLHFEVYEDNVAVNPLSYTE